ncbi:tetratricopeptide repeat protein, partial [Leptolyngbya cf. ectocarpi LEGE 11479]
MDKQSWYVRQKARLAYRRGCTLARQGNHQGAIAILTQALTDHPEPAEVHTKRGLSYRALKQLDSARQDFMAAINCADNPATAYFYRGQISSDQGQITEAISDWHQAIAHNPNYT